MAEAKKGKLNTRRISADLRGLDLAELEKRLAEEREKLMRDRFRHATAALENTASLKTSRRQIARLETIITEKKIAAERKAAQVVGADMATEAVQKTLGLNPDRKETATIKSEEGADA